MSQIVNCPSCRNPLRVSDELLGGEVRCPTCRTIFQPAAAAAPAGVPPAVAPSLSLDDEPEEAKPRPQAWGAVEIDSSPPPNAPSPQRVPPRDPPSGDPDDWERRPPRRRSYEDDYDDRPRRRYYDDEDRPRRHSRWRGDGDPHRGPLILTLGILSLCFAIVAPLGLCMGIFAWAMGASDLDRMRRGELDPDGQSLTSGGQVCGILGSIASVLILLLYALAFMGI